MRQELNNAVKNYSTKKLCELFELTNEQPITIELAEVRGALMDELKSRDSKAFDLWIDSFPHTVSDYPSRFFK